MKIVINKCYGGFDLSQEAWVQFFQLKFPTNNILESSYVDTYFYEIELRKTWEDDWNEKAFRTDPFLIQVIEELGTKANTDNSRLKIINIPFDSTEGWEIEEYGGKEWIAEKHNKWS